MLAANLLRYWWLKPQIPDPRHVETHDPLKATSIVSILEPESGPQFKKQKKWAKIPHYYGGKDPMQRSVIEIERELAAGKDLILVEPEMAAQVYYHYIAHGWILLENTLVYGSSALVLSYLFPRRWIWYVSCSCMALIHSYVYFRVYKYDRLSQYQAYDDDRHPVSNLVTAWVLGQRPDHFQYVLRKKKVTFWEILASTVLYSSLISTLKSLADIETYVLGDGKIELSLDTETLFKELLTPAFHAGYFRPPDLIHMSKKYYLPSDIPCVSGWFDIPWLGFYPKAVRYDLAIIICGLGFYLMYKTFGHFFGASDEDEGEDEVGREWIKTEEEKKEILNTPKDFHWVEIEDNREEFLLGKMSKNTLCEQVHERDEITRITSQSPYGWVSPGYPDNHYGMFT